MPRLQTLAISAKDKATSGTGIEPDWDDFDPKKRGSDVISSFNFYNYHFDYKLAHNLVLDYLVQTKQMDKHNVWKKVPLRSIPNAIGWMARMICRGYPATDQQIAQVNTAIDYAITLIPKKEVIELDPKKKTANVQEIMREKANLLGGELEYLLDTYIDAGVPVKHKISPIVKVKLSNILPQHVPDLVKHWEGTCAEFTKAYNGDVDLDEGYAHFTKPQRRRLVKFAELVIADLNSYVTFKKTTKAKPKRRVKTPEQQVVKLKFARECKELKLKSVKPAKIIGAKEMYVYSPKKRKLHYYIADEQAGNALMVKNSTIVGFDPNKTAMKTIRKPEELLKKLMSASRPATRKMFDSINAVEAKLSGRFQSDFVILKVW